MAGDYSRNTFRPADEHAAVLLQQGRVVVDADWNALVELLDRRLNVETVDIIGRCRVPRETEDAFEITPVPGDLEIGVGRAYVDGIQVHNRGSGTMSAEPVWDEPFGDAPASYVRQPYLFDAAMPSAAGRQLAYLDVWRREVTAIEDERLVDPAIGVDTATRLQTIWQVRLLGVDEGVGCNADWGKVQAWLDATGRSGARLVTRGVGTPAATDPCLIPPSGGYRGIDNRLYRVEIHDGGSPASPAGGATFKWSRSNVAVAARITGPIQDPGAAPKVPVDVLGKDGILRFQDGDQIEILDDVIELAGRPGAMARIKPNGVDAARSILSLDAPFTGVIDFTRNPRVRRWDQRTGLTNGVIPVVLNQAVELEDGVEIELRVGDDGYFHTGDFWTFATRTADASVEELDAARPRGIRHHYCRLAILDLPADADSTGKLVEDCRDLWPPEFGGGCDCDACLTAPDGDAADLLQGAIDDLGETGGRICLGPGLFRISRPLTLSGAVSLRISGKGWRSVIAYLGRGPAIRIERCANVTLDELTIAVVPQAERETPPPEERTLGILSTEDRPTNIYELETAETGAVDQPAEDEPPVALVAPSDEVEAAVERLPRRRPFAAVGIRNSVDVTIRRCVVIAASLPDVITPATSLKRASSGTRLAYGSLAAVLASGLNDLGTCVALQGILVQTRIEDNVFLGNTGVQADAHLTELAARESGFHTANTDAPETENEASGTRSVSSAATMTEYAAYVLTVGLTVEDNAMACVTSGIDLKGFSIQLGDTQVARNVVLGCARAGIVATGIVPGSWLGGEATTSLGSGLLRSRLDVRGNVLQVLGHGIVVGTDEARIVENDIGSIPIGEERLGLLLREYGGYDRGLPAVRGGHGILLVNGLDRLGVDRCQVLGNRLVGVRGDGIHIGGTIASAMIKHNVIQDPGGGGIVMDADAEARTLTVENNQILGVAPRANARGTTLAGIQLVQVAAGDVSSNTVAGLGRQATDADQAVGIRVEAQAAGTVRIAGNDVSDVGPNVDGVGIDGSVRNIGIQVTGSFDRADVVDNSVRRSRVTPDPRSTDTEGRWRAVEIRGVIQRKRLEIEMLELDDLERMERLSTVERAAEVERAEVDSEASAAWMTWRTRSYVVPPDAVRDEYIGIIAGRATKLPAGREIAAARGNLLDGYGTGSSLVVAVAGAATATDNRATLSGNGTSVRIEAEAAIIASNYVVGPPETTPIELRLPANGPFTVVGNISSGPIEVNGQELSATVAGAPFAPLNVSAS